MRVLSRLMTLTNVNYTFRVINHVPAKNTIPPQPLLLLFAFVSGDVPRKPCSESETKPWKSFNVSFKSLGSSLTCNLVISFISPICTCHFDLTMGIVGIFTDSFFCEPIGQAFVIADPILWPFVPWNRQWTESQFVVVVEGNSRRKRKHVPRLG